MSYITELYMNHQIAEAAKALDLLQAAQNHKLPADAKKHTVLAAVMREATERFQKLAHDQSVYTPDEFFKKAFERVRQMRAEAAELAKIRREKRERDTAEREAIQKEMALIAA